MTRIIETSKMQIVFIWVDILVKFVQNEIIMQTTYRLNAQEISDAFLQSLKTLFAGQEIEIIVKPVTDNRLDETTILAQTTLADEWESPEDQRWDNLL